MKKLLLTAVVVLGSLSAFADYSYLQFKSADGESQYVSTKGLTINVENGVFNITNSAGQSLSLDSDNLMAMMFTNEDGTNAIDAISVENSAVSVYSVSGLFQGKFNTPKEAVESLSNGVYILKSQSGKTFKIIVEK